MTVSWIGVAAAGLLAALFAVRTLAGRRAVRRARALRSGRGLLERLDDSIGTEAGTGAVRSVQAADLLIAEEQLAAIWTPAHLERLARTYWRFLTRVTLGLIRVCYSERERWVVLLVRPLRLLTFQAPEYELEGDRGLVRWRIDRGLLVARRGRGRGYLQIEVTRSPGPRQGLMRLHVEVEVANFYPAIAAGLSRRVYDVTQSRIHVIVTHGFLRSLARLDLAESRVGRLRQPAS
jgi:hypothetical protein